MYSFHYAYMIEMIDRQTDRQTHVKIITANLTPGAGLTPSRHLKHSLSKLLVTPTASETAG